MLQKIKEKEKKMGNVEKQYEEERKYTEHLREEK